MFEFPVRNQKGFNIVEMMIVLAVILIIIAISAGVYFAVTSRAEAARIENIIVKTLPTAMSAYKLDLGIDLPDNDSFCNKRMLALKDKSGAPIGVQAKWKGPYVNPDFIYNEENPGSLQDAKAPDITYAFNIADPNDFASIASIRACPAAAGFGCYVSFRTIIANNIPSDTATSIKKELGENAALKPSSWDADDNPTAYQIIYITNYAATCLYAVP